MRMPTYFRNYEFPLYWTAYIPTAWQTSSYLWNHICFLLLHLPSSSQTKMYLKTKFTIGVAVDEPISFVKYDLHMICLVLSSNFRNKLTAKCQDNCWDSSPVSKSFSFWVLLIKLVVRSAGGIIPGSVNKEKIHSCSLKNQIVCSIN